MIQYTLSGPKSEITKLQKEIKCCIFFYTRIVFILKNGSFK